MMFILYANDRLFFQDLSDYLKRIKRRSRGAARAAKSLRDGVYSNC